MRGEPVWYLVPDGVVQYITKHDLYAPDRTRPRQLGRTAMTATDRALELVRTAAQAASDKLAEHIVAFDVTEQLVITDAFLLCSAPNDRQVKAIVDEIEDKLREIGAKPVRREGERDGRWVLIDYGEIVVHVQHEEERQFYALERLWRDCPLIPLPADVPPSRPTSGDPSAALVLLRHGQTAWNGDGPRPGARRRRARRDRPRPGAERSRRRSRRYVRRAVVQRPRPGGRQTASYVGRPCGLRRSARRAAAGVRRRRACRASPPRSSRPPTRRSTPPGGWAGTTRCPGPSNLPTYVPASSAALRDQLDATEDGDARRRHPWRRLKLGVGGCSAGPTPGRGHPLGHAQLRAGRCSHSPRRSPARLVAYNRPDPDFVIVSGVR